MASGDELIFDLEGSARAAYEIVRTESQRPTWWSDWDDMSDHERGVWLRAAGAVVEHYDPVIFGTAMTELRRLWRVISPVVIPYLALLVRSDEKSCTHRPEDHRGRFSLRR